MKHEAVTFDFWNTLVLETHEPVETRKVMWVEILTRAGHDVSEPVIEDAFRHSWTQFELRWKANEQSTARLMTADAVSHLPFEVSTRVEDELVDAYLEASVLTRRELLPGVGETFQELRRRGLVIGIISDIGAVPGTQIGAWLDELGVGELVSHRSFSDEVGVFKPAAEIFNDALVGLGATDPSRVAHVGDLRRTDVAGANAMGMVSVQYTGARKDPADDDAASEQPDHVISSHEELFEVLDFGD